MRCTRYNGTRSSTAHSLVELRELQSLSFPASAHVPLLDLAAIIVTMQDIDEEVTRLEAQKCFVEKCSEPVSVLDIVLDG